MPIKIYLAATVHCVAGIMASYLPRPVVPYRYENFGISFIAVSLEGRLRAKDLLQQ
jgi:hypothetical protein